MDILVNTFKSLFPKDINQAAYLAYDKFETFKRPSDMSMVDFINLKGFIITQKSMKWNSLQEYWPIDC